MLLLTSRQSLKGRGWIMVAMALAAFTCVLYIGFDAVYDRLASLGDFHKAESGRLQILKDIAVAWTKFPMLGTGLGTHAVVYPMFDSSTIPELATHAENEYAQAVEEIGLIGLGSLIIFGIIVWLNYAKSIRNSNLPILSAAYGLGFGILAILIHSLSDFGQHVPANTFLTAIFCALLLSLARQGGEQDFATQTVTPSWKWSHSRVLRSVVFVIISGIAAWSFIGADNSRIAERYWAKVLNIEKGLVDKNWQGTDAEFADLISYATSASDYQPENIEYRYWLNVYRWYKISRSADPNTGVLPEDSISSVRDIVDEFHKARSYCPTYGPTYCTLGQIEKLILGDDAGGTERIRKGFRLAPCDPIVCFITGLVDIEEDQIDQSFEKFERAVQLDGKLFKGIVDIYISKVGRPDLAMAIAGDRTSRLSYVANILADMDEQKELVEDARAKVMNLLKEKCSQPDAPASVFASLASIYRKQQDNEAAIEYYRRALALDYGQVNWRFTLAELLADTGYIREAMHEAKICLRLRPQFKAAEKLIMDLSVHPKILNEEASTP